MAPDLWTFETASSIPTSNAVTVPAPVVGDAPTNNAPLPYYVLRDWRRHLLEQSTANTSLYHVYAEATFNRALLPVTLRLLVTRRLKAECDDLFGDRG